MDCQMENKPVLMGIVNLTPDSFYAPSRARSAGELSSRISDLLSRGCSIIDFGAVSTRPGAEDVPPEEEWRRLLDALQMFSGESSPGFDISVDTFRSGIVRKVFELLGRPFTVNDISAGEDDPEMLETVAELHLPYIAMHKRGNPRNMDSLTVYKGGVTCAVIDYFEEFAGKAAGYGIEDWILDPGFGFAKTVTQNWELLSNLSSFKRFGRPVLAGVADKRFTKDPQFNGGDPTLAERLAVIGGADILRIH